MSKYAVMVPVDECANHDYVWLKEEVITCTEPYTRIIPKEIYACVHCGVAMEVYDLVNKIDINRHV